MALNAGDHIASDFDIVISKLANFGVVDTQNLIFFGSAEAETRDQIDEEKDETATKEGVREASNRVG